MHIFDHSQDGEVGWGKYDGTILKCDGDHFEDDLLQGSVVEDVLADRGEGGDQVLRESSRPLGKLLIKCALTQTCKCDTANIEVHLEPSLIFCQCFSRAWLL